MHFPCENYGVCGKIEGGNIELFFTKRGEAEDLNHLSQGKKTTNKQCFSLSCVNISLFPGITNYPLPFLVQMRLVASVIQSKSTASLDVCLCAYIFHMNLRSFK